MDRDVERKALRQRDGDAVAGGHAGLGEQRRDAEALVAVVGVAAGAGGVAIGGGVGMRVRRVKEIAGEVAGRHAERPRAAAMMTFWRSEVPE